MRFFDDDEILRVTKAARATTAHGFAVYKYGEILVLDIYTGLRSGEFIALKKKDVELEKRRIKVHSGLVTYYDLDEDSPIYKTSVSFHSEQTKTGNGMRYVPLCDEALQIIAYLYSRCKQDEDYSITGSRDTVLYSNILRTYKNICTRAEWADPRGIHTLRHTCASLLIRNKTDIKIVSEMLGHSSVTFTYDSYVHLIKEQTDEAVKKLGNAMAGKERMNQKAMVEAAVSEGLTQKVIVQLLAVMTADTLGVLLSEIF